MYLRHPSFHSPRGKILQGKARGQGRGEKKKCRFMGLFLKRGEKKKGKGITYSCSDGPCFNSAPVALSTWQREAIDLPWHGAHRSGSRPARRRADVCYQLPEHRNAAAFGVEPSERLLSSAPSRRGEGIAKRCRRDPSRRDAVGGKPWESGNVAKDLRSTAESKLDVLFAVWLGKKSTAAGFPGWRGHT